MAIDPEKIAERYYQYVLHGKKDDVLEVIRTLGLRALIDRTRSSSVSYAPSKKIMTIFHVLKLKCANLLIDPRCHKYNTELAQTQFGKDYLRKILFSEVQRFLTTQEHEVLSIDTLFKILSRKMTKTYAILSNRINATTGRPVHPIVMHGDHLCSATVALSYCKTLGNAFHYFSNNSTEAVLRPRLFSLLTPNINPPEGVSIHGFR